MQFANAHKKYNNNFTGFYKHRRTIKRFIRRSWTSYSIKHAINYNELERIEV